MGFIILGIGVGLWMYSFVNHRFNEQPWVSSSLVFWVGLVVIVVSIFLFIIH